MQLTLAEIRGENKAQDSPNRGFSSFFPAKEPQVCAMT